jgi:nucleoside-diphosphate-sugar epimerase
MVDVLITGAGGFIGQTLVRRLRDEGCEVLALARADGDVVAEATWTKLPAARWVIHLAGRSYIPDSWRQGEAFTEANVLGTQRALAYCKRHGARMVYASAYVYGIPARLPIAESDPVRPNNPYALSKYMGEQLCEFASRYQDVPATAFRIFNVFGERQRPEFLIPTLISQVLEGKEIRVMDLAPRRDYVFVEDVAEAFVKALAAPPGFHCANIGSGTSYSVKQIIDVIQSAAGTSLPVISQSSERPQEIPDVQADITLAREALGWSPRWTFAEGIRKVLNGAKS